MGLKIWAILITAFILLGAVTLYVVTAEGAKSDRKVLKAQAEQDGLTIISQKAEIKTLNERIKANNAANLAKLEAEAKRVAEAKKSAEELKIQRDTIARELAASRRAWAEAVANDEILRDWVDDPVPTAVWERLRIAAGQSTE